MKRQYLLLAVLLVNFPTVAFAENAKEHLQKPVSSIVAQPRQDSSALSSPPPSEVAKTISYEGELYALVKSPELQKVFSDAIVKGFMGSNPQYFHKDGKWKPSHSTVNDTFFTTTNDQLCTRGTPSATCYAVYKNSSSLAEPKFLAQELLVGQESSQYVLQIKHRDLSITTKSYTLPHSIEYHGKIFTLVKTAELEKIVPGSEMGLRTPKHRFENGKVTVQDIPAPYVVDYTLSDDRICYSKGHVTRCTALYQNSGTYTAIPLPIWNDEPQFYIVQYKRFD